MPPILVLGAGVCGLATALMLARDGHEVTVLERDTAPPPEAAADAFDGWQRRGVPQFNQAHFVQPLARIADGEPGVTVRRWVAVAALELRRLDGRMHVIGVRTEAGETLHADLVIDAMGRGSRLPRLLTAAGAEPPHEEAEDCGFRTTRASCAAPSCPRRARRS
jgi:2-polyprenyl-6-methoxyphenol hydroxylase-like FAD-dependent oxidoreductase